MIIIKKYIYVRMKTKDFYIFRHGQTDFNAQGRWQGSGVDTLLNETGIEQAKALQKKIVEQYPGKCRLYSSPLLRAVQTANIISDHRWCKLNFEVMHDLRECHFGEAEGLTFEEANQKYGEDFVNKILFPTFDTWDESFPGGESKHEVFNRVYACLRNIFRVNTWVCDNSLFVVCHAGVISALQCGLGLENVSYENCSVLHLRYDAEEGRFSQIVD